MPYNPQIHHRRSIRLKGYDYSQAGAYFITICTQNHACLFGFVGAPLVGDQNNCAIQNNGVIQNNGAIQNNGVIQNNGAKNDGAKNDVVIQNETDFGNDDGEPQIGRPQGPAPTVARNGDAPKFILNDAGKMVEIEWLKLTERFPNIELHEFVVMPNHFHGILQIVDVAAAGKTVGDMMDAFKSITTVEYIHGVKTLDWEKFNRKLWQRNYYEHIIRDEKSYQRISEYIINNPYKWKDDKFYTK
jgi:putative transposase